MDRIYIGLEADRLAVASILVKNKYTVRQGSQRRGTGKSYGDQVHLITSGDDAGCFGTTGGIAINARFITTAQNGIAAIELYNQLNAAPAASGN